MCMQVCMAENNMSVLKHAGIRFFLKRMANWVHPKHQSKQKYLDICSILNVLNLCNVSVLIKCNTSHRYIVFSGSPSQRNHCNIISHMQQISYQFSFFISFFFSLIFLYTKAYTNLKQEKIIFLESTKVKHNKHSFIFRFRREVDIECTEKYFHFMNKIYEGKFYILKLSHLTLSLHEAQMCTRTMMRTNAEQQR